MNKDVIYIDIEDDITAIISKIKSSAKSIVALVPPKRVGVLHSVVNLKLLQRAAKSESKHVVLITSDNALLSLASGIKMPVAKNLQSRPEIPNTNAPENADEEVINGNEMSVGELDSKFGSNSQNSNKNEANPKSKADEIEEVIDLKSEPVDPSDESTPDGKKPEKLKKAKGRGVPNFDAFRVKLIVGVGAGIALVTFLVWAFVFAPTAKVTIAAKNKAVNVDRTLSLDPSIEASNIDGLSIKPMVQQVKKSVAAEFTATGTKDIGTRAKGKITVENCDSTTSFSLAAGSTFVAAGGFQFKSDTSVTVPGFTGSSSTCRSTGEGAGAVVVNVTANAVGPEYNIGATTFTISGLSGDVYASSISAMTGGTKEQVTAVSQEDVDKAKESLTNPDVTTVKKELLSQFGDDYVVIEESFISTHGDAVASPAVGEQAQSAKVTVETTYTIIGITRDDAKAIIQKVVDDYLASNTDQQLFVLGDDSIQFQAFQQLSSGKYSVRMGTTSYVGAKVDLDELKERMSGKVFGEIEAIANEIPDVTEVNIELSPFWVTTAPSADKIEITFSIEKNGN